MASRCQLVYLYHMRMVRLTKLNIQRWKIQKTHLTYCRNEEQFWEEITGGRRIAERLRSPQGIVHERTEALACRRARYGPGEGFYYRLKVESDMAHIHFFFGVGFRWVLVTQAEH